MRSFNPRPLAGDDTHKFQYLALANRVSIHVPLRGTTPQFCPIISKIYFKNTYISHISPYHYTVFPFLSPPFQPILCNFSGANPPEFLCLLHIRTQMPLHNKNPICGSSSVNSHMFYFCFILISQIIKP